MRIRVACGIMAVLLAVAIPATAQVGGALDILRAAERSVYPDAFRMVVNLENFDRERRTTTMQLEVQYKKDVGTRIEILSPVRSKGIRMLETQGTLWMYNPKAGGQAIRLSPRASFQGSVFSNRDIGDPQYSEQYDVRIVGNETWHHPELGDVATLVLEGVARRSDAAYAKVRLRVRVSDSLLLEAEYYAKSGLLFRSTLFAGIRPLAGRSRPTVLRMSSLDEPGKSSVMTITSLEADPNLSDAVFSLSAMTR